MKRVLLSLVVLAGSAALAAPATIIPFPDCYPSDIGGSGSKAVIGETANQEYLGWKCIDRGQKFTEWYVVKAKKTALSITPSANKDLSKLADSYWTSNVKKDVNSPEFAEGLKALKKALAKVPNPKDSLGPNGSWDSAGVKNKSRQLKSATEDTFPVPVEATVEAKDSGINLERAIPLK